MCRVREWAVLAVVLTCRSSLADQPTDPTLPGAPPPPAFFKFGDGNKINSGQYSSLRVYKVVDADGNPIKRTEQPDGYPRFFKTPQEAEEYFKNLPADEQILNHGGIDYSSHGPDGKPKAQEFGAGVYGKVVKADPNAPDGKVVVRIDDRGNTVEFFHLSKSYVKEGDTITPDTVLGMTGGKGAGGRIHLHVQAKNPSRQILDAAEVLRYGAKPPVTRKVPAWFIPAPTSYNPPAAGGAAESRPAPQPTPTPTDNPERAISYQIIMVDDAAKRADAGYSLVVDEYAKRETASEGCRGRGKKAADDKAQCEARAKQLAKRKTDLQEREGKLKERRAGLDKEKAQLDKRKGEFDREKGKLDKTARKKALDELNAAVDALAAKFKDYDRDASALLKDTAAFNKEVEDVKKQAKGADEAAAAAAKEEKEQAAKMKQLALKKTKLADEVQSLKDERARLQEALEAEQARAKDAKDAEPAKK